MEVTVDKNLQVPDYLQSLNSANGLEIFLLKAAVWTKLLKTRYILFQTMHQGFQHLSPEEARESLEVFDKIVIDYHNILSGAKTQSPFLNKSIQKNLKLSESIQATLEVLSSEAERAKLGW
ncbi:MAG: hypothetical protein KDK41_15290 [Leptospiraceae bacterium]|nr:hypothetical protein [Leptospiraceae bacterium]